MRQKLELAAALLILAGLIILSRNVSKHVSSTKVENGGTQVVLDAGHGNSDPGKVGVNGAKEKDINLAIARKVEALLKKQGVTVVMTREDDRTLAKAGHTNQKIEDMKERVKLINTQAPRIAVSIHQNSYEQESIAGAQVFYYTHSDEGKGAAEIMQKALLTFDEDNTRQPKANDTYYLLKRIEVPIIIVECGFLSNHAEAELLVTEEYQQKVARAICDGVVEYLER